MALAHAQAAHATELIPGLFDIDIMTKQLGSTFFVHLEINAEAAPRKLIDDLSEAGFAPAPHGAPPFYRDGVAVLGVDFVKPGSGLFNGWTATERVANLAEVRAILAVHGLRVEPRVASFAEFN